MAGIEVKWKKMGSEFTYNVLIASKITGPWSIHNRELLTDESLDKKRIAQDSTYVYSSENEFLIDSLKDNTKYFVKIACYDRYYEWWYSYSDVESIEGGLGSSFNRPLHGGGNVVSFQVNI